MNQSMIKKKFKVGEKLYDLFSNDGKICKVNDPDDNNSWKEFHLNEGKIIFIRE